MGLRGIGPLTNHVRMRLSRQICNTLVGPGGYIPIVTLSPKWESDFMAHITGPAEDRKLAMPPSMLNVFVGKLRDTFNALSTNGEIPVIVVASPVRDSMHAIVERVRPSISVLSQAEIYPRARIKTVATIS